MLYSATTVTQLDPIYPSIMTYINNGQWHSYGINVIDILKIRRRDFSQDFDKNPDTSKQLRMMLWHGTKVENVASILKNGFSIPPPNNQLLGTGIYFADKASKSANYCKLDRTSTIIGETGYLFLCDVLLGRCFKAPHYPGQTHTLTGPPTKTDNATGEIIQCDSLMCPGELIPDWDENVKWEGSVMPIGGTVINPSIRREGRLMFNEYVVYSSDRIKVKYLVKFTFVEEPVSN